MVYLKANKPFYNWQWSSVELTGAVLLRATPLQRDSLDGAVELAMQLEVSPATSDFITVRLPPGTCQTLTGVQNQDYSISFTYLPVWTTAASAATTATGAISMIAAAVTSAIAGANPMLRASGMPYELQSELLSVVFHIQFVGLASRLGNRLPDSLKAYSLGLQWANLQGLVEPWGSRLAKYNATPTTISTGSRRRSLLSAAVSVLQYQEQDSTLYTVLLQSFQSDWVLFGVSIFWALVVVAAAAVLRALLAHLYRLVFMRGEIQKEREARRQARAARKAVRMGDRKISAKPSFYHRLGVRPKARGGPFTAFAVLGSPLPCPALTSALIGP